MSELAAEMRVERKAKLSQTVVQALRAQIVGGDFAVGEKLPTEMRMSEIFGVSRTVVREAVAILAADGLVEPRHGAGVFVRSNPQSKIALIAAEVGNRISQAINVLEVRMGLESESAGLAAERRNPSQEARIQEAFFEFDRLLHRGEPTGKADFAFHREIAGATNNPFYVEVLSPDYLQGLQREHLAVLQAISAGEADAARDAMRRHLVAAQQRYRHRLTCQQDSYAASTDPANASAQIHGS